MPACNNLGNWSYGTTASGACNSMSTITIYGDSFNVGETLYSGSLCNPSDEISNGYYSNGIVAFRYLGGFRFFVSCYCEDDYCVFDTILFDDTYEVAGTYDNNVYFSGLSTSYVIYYSTGQTQWCLSSSLGGVCDLWGPMGSTSQCPDLDASLFSSGVCQTIITSTDPCAVFDFNAVFDCFSIPPPPPPSASPTMTPTPTPTPTPTNPCGGFAASITGLSITPTPSVTASPTPSATPDITRPCNFSGTATFNGISERIICGDSKKFKDCFTGFDYYTTQPLLDPIGNPLSEGYVYQVVVNGVQLCAIYEGLNQNISGVDNVQIVGVIGDSAQGACLQCIPSTPEPIYDCLVVHSECAGGNGTISVNPGAVVNGRFSYSFNFPLIASFSSYTYTIYWDDINVRWVVADSTNNLPAGYLNLDIPMPIGSNSEWVSVPPPLSPSLACITTGAGFYTTNTGIACPTPTPTLTPNNTVSPTPTPTVTPTVTPIPCCSTFTNLKLPGGSVSLNGVTLTFSSTQPSGLIITTSTNTFLPVCLPPQQLINCLFTSPNSLLDWDYTINFNQPVNNVKIQIINYSSSWVYDIQEKITFTTNTNVPTIVNCDGCNVIVQNNSIICDPPPFAGVNGGSGAFIISTTTPFTSLTLTPSMVGTNPQNYKVGVFIRICDLTTT